VFIATAASVLGLVIGATTWVLVAPQLSVFGVAIGYLAGTVTISSVALASTWRREQQRWRGLIFRLATAVAILVGLLAAQRTLTLNYWLDPAFAVAFCLAWFAFSKEGRASGSDASHPASKA